MEYVVLRAVHPRWFSVQFPEEAAELLQYHPESPAETRLVSRTIAFLARGPGIVRVVAAHPAREAIAVETVRNRLVGTARLGDRMVFNLPYAVIRHLGLLVHSRGPRAGRGSDDGIVWLAQAPEYYEFRGAREAKKEWTGPTSGGFVHLYLMKSIAPFPRELDHLEEVENRIEEREWHPWVAALLKVERTKRVV